MKIVVQVLILLLIGCSNSPRLGEKTKIPGDSIATISYPLSIDAVSNIKAWSMETYNCGNVMVKNTVQVSTQGKVLMDGKGRLFSGIITEKWTAHLCGRTSDLGMVFQSDGSGGSIIAIAEIEE